MISKRFAPYATTLVDRALYDTMQTPCKLLLRQETIGCCAPRIFSAVIFLVLTAHASLVVPLSDVSIQRTRKSARDRRQSYVVSESSYVRYYNTK